MLKAEQVTITPLKEVNEKSTAAEIWINKILIDHQDYDKDTVPLPEGWQVLDNCIYAADARTAEPLAIDLPERCEFEIEFAMTEASGILQYCVDACDVRVDLYNKERVSRIISPEEIWGRVTEAPGWERIVYYTIYFMILWFLVETVVYICYCHYRKRRDFGNAIDAKKMEN